MMSSIKRDVKKKAPPRPESRFISRDSSPLYIGLAGAVLPFHSHKFLLELVMAPSSLRERQASAG
jgi:hypothetical protein